MALPKIVSETKKETKEKRPPEDLEFCYLPGRTGMEKMKAYLSKFL